MSLTLEQVLELCPGPRTPNGEGFLVRCPVHKEKTPSCSIKAGNDGRILVHCFGCNATIQQFAEALGKDVRDFMGNGASGHEIPNARKEPTKPAPKPIDFAPFQTAYLDEKAPWLQILSKKRGYSIDFCRQLGQVGLMGVEDGFFLIPSFTASKVTGYHKWDPDPDDPKQRWSVVGGQLNPLIIGSNEDLTVIFESQWDAFAYMDSIGYLKSPHVRDSQRIVITRGVSRAKSLLNRFRTGAKGRFYIFQQNDPRQDTPDNGELPLTPAEKHSSELITVLPGGILYHALVPEAHKDVNDWIRDGGATTAEVLDALQTARPWRDPRKPPIPSVVSWSMMLNFKADSDKDCILGNRYLSRGGSALIVGGTGVGKSVFSYQGAIELAIGKPLFGISNKAPRTSVIIQAEDDLGDMSESIQGVLRHYEITSESPLLKTIEERVHIYRVTDRIGADFFAMAHELVTLHSADFLWVNPISCFFKGSMKEELDVQAFTLAVNSLATHTGVCTMLIAHTPKPKESQNVAFQDVAHSAFGSSYWANWARAVIVLQGAIDRPDVASITFAKRGLRTGIVSEEDPYEKVTKVYVEHAQTGLAWVPSDYTPPKRGNAKNGDYSKSDARPGPKTVYTFQKFLDNSMWNKAPIPKTDFLNLIRSTFGYSQSNDRRAYRCLYQWLGVQITLKDNDTVHLIPPPEA